MLYRALLALILGIYASAEKGLADTTDAPTAARDIRSDDAAGHTQQAQAAERIRTHCIEGRRYIAGRVLQITPQGLVVDSGYSKLLSPPFNRSWLVPGTASLDRDSSRVEENKADAVCAGLVFLSNIPKRPVVKNYDFVVIHGYPAGNYVYVPAPGVEKTIRRFSASLDRAVDFNLSAHPH